MVPIYLDNNATTPLDPRVAEAMAECARLGPLNAGSQHTFGRAARRRLEDARDAIGHMLGAKLSGAKPDRVIFTSGGTEGNNLALLGLAPRTSARVIVSAIEHPSVMGAAEQLRRQGHDVQLARVTRGGVVDLDHFRALLTPEARLASVMLGNNETGVVQPVEEIARICAANGTLLHCDAVQAVGKLPVDLVNFSALGVHALSASAHKLHGPTGIGVLIVRGDVQLTPQLHGGFQQAGMRPGTEPVALAVGFCEALRQWYEEAESRAGHFCGMRDVLEEDLVRECQPMVINGAGERRLPHTSNVAFVGLDRQALLMALDLAGVACSTGSACASGSSEPSPVLLAMGCVAPVLRGSIRFSVGAQTTLAEVMEASRRIIKVVNDLRLSENGRKLSSAAPQATRGPVK